MVYTLHVNKAVFKKGLMKINMSKNKCKSITKVCGNDKSKNRNDFKNYLGAVGQGKEQ